MSRLKPRFFLEGLPIEKWLEERFWDVGDKNRPRLESGERVDC